MKEDFQPPEYDERLLDEIKRRTQGKNESMGIFIAVMTNMFERLSKPIEESSKLKIILKNISPFYQMNLCLTEIESVSELLKYCKKLETKKYNIDNFALPVRNKNDLEPDLAYVSTDIDDDERGDMTSDTRVSLIKCWNCEGTGHRSSQCSEAKRKHCYRCGKIGYTVRNCPKCSSNSENASTSH